MLRDEYMCITMNGRTFCVKNYYYSLPVAFITEQWELVALPLACIKSEGVITGKGLAQTIESIVMHHGLAGPVVA